MKCKKRKKVGWIGCLFLILGSLFFIFPKYPLKEICPIHFFIIQTGSMLPEIEIGEMVVVKRKKDYQRGDIITYQVHHSYFITHRIIEKTEEGFYTKGDFNNTKDEEIITQEEIQGKVILHSKLLGRLYQYRFVIIGILVVLLVIA